MRQEPWVPSLGQEDPLEEETTTHSSVLVWEIPWTEEPGNLQITASQSQIQLSNGACTQAKVLQEKPKGLRFSELKNGAYKPKS